MFKGTVSIQDRFTRRPAEPLGSCGVIFPDWKEQNGGFFAENCRFHEEMEPLNTTASVSFKYCLDDCAGNVLCTHFVYDGATSAQLGTCQLLAWPTYQGQQKTVILSHKKSPTSSCGFFYKSSPSFIQGVLNKYWPFIVGVTMFMALIGEGLIIKLC